MRISTGYLYASHEGELSRTASAYFDAQIAVSTGKRIRQASDDPSGTVTALSLRSLKSSVEQYNSNLDRGKAFLSMTESALSETSNVVNSAYTLAVGAANSITDANARNGMIDQVNGLEQRLLQLANTKGPSGQYIFAGQATDKEPFTTNAGVLSYGGDSGTISIETSPSDTLTVNVPGDAVFTKVYGQLEDLKKHLAAADAQSISSASLADLKSSLDGVAGLRGGIGAKLQTIQQLQQHNADRLQQFTQGISDVEDVDVTQAVVNLKQAETAYQAALSSTSQSNRFSLLDFIQ